MAKQPSQDIQGEALGVVKQTFEDYRTLLQNYRTTWFDLHQATYVFQTKRQGLGKSTAFFPKCYENLQRVSPRIYGNRPKFVLSMVAPIPDISPAEGPGMIEQQQKALNYFWKMSGCEKKARTLVDAGLVYGTAFAKSSIQQKLKKLKTEKTKNVKGVETVTIVETEEVVTEYPTFEVPDIFDMYFDPRIESERDYPSIIENMDNVRIADILANTEKYFNLDMVANANSAAYSQSGDNKKLQKFQAEGISQDYTGQVGRGNLKEFYGYFSETQKIEDEKFVKITVFNDSFVIGYEEVDCHPYIKFNPVEIPNQGCGLGIVEPIKQLQDVYNLTRNQRLENVSMVINRMWLMKQGAGLDPRTLQSRAGNVIMTKDMDAIRPLDTPDVTASSYNETQALNTEIQGILGTIDTTQDAGENGFTNLATGQKIRWNEFNSRFKAIKENFEEALSKVGQKMLRTVAKEAAFDPIIEDEVTQRFFKMARENFDKASDFYSVSVLADSTASDSIENKRDESLAFGQLAIAYKAQGLNIPLEVVWKDIVGSYPGKNPEEYILPAPPPQPEQGQPGEQAENQAEEAAEGAEVQAGSQEEGEMLNDSLIPQDGPMGEDSAEALNEQLTQV